MKGEVAKAKPNKKIAKVDKKQKVKEVVKKAVDAGSKRKAANGVKNGSPAKKAKKADSEGEEESDDDVSNQSYIYNFIFLLVLGKLFALMVYKSKLKFNLK